jgi:hypothetical protein
MASLLILTTALAACETDGDEDGDGDGPDGDEVAQMVSDPSGSASFRVLSATDADESADLIAMLPSARVSLASGFQQAASDGYVISGKFELSDEGTGPISLSVYTARGGKDVIPEENELAELAGDPTGSTWSPEAEVFEDMEHVARASQHLTLMQITSATLDSVARAAGELGTVYAVYPAVYAGQPVFDVRVAGDDGTVSQVRLALNPL